MYTALETGHYLLYCRRQVVQSAEHGPVIADLERTEAYRPSCRVQQYGSSQKCVGYRVRKTRWGWRGKCTAVTNSVLQESVSSVGQIEKSARPERKNFPFLSAATPAQATPVITGDCELIRNFANNN